jgi:hypothetical protein
MKEPWYTSIFYRPEGQDILRATHRRMLGVNSLDSAGDPDVQIGTTVQVESDGSATVLDGSDSWQAGYFSHYKPGIYLVIPDPETGGGGNFLRMLQWVRSTPRTLPFFTRVSGDQHRREIRSGKRRPPYTVEQAREVRDATARQRRPPVIDHRPTATRPGASSSIFGSVELPDNDMVERRPVTRQETRPATRPLFGGGTQGTAYWRAQAQAAQQRARAAKSRGDKLAAADERRKQREALAAARKAGRTSGYNAGEEAILEALEEELVAQEQQDTSADDYSTGGSSYDPFDSSDPFSDY